jgi:ribosome maturation factor RimP
MTTDTYTRERQLTREIAPVVESRLGDVEVLAVELLAPHRFCVYVDRPTGVDLELCAQVTHLLDRYRAEWTIDVSSPGPKRPLRTARHFAAVIGRTVELRHLAGSGVQRARGVVARADDDAVLLDVAGVETPIPYEALVRANLIDEGR